MPVWALEAADRAVRRYSILAGGNQNGIVLPTYLAEHLQLLIFSKGKGMIMPRKFIVTSVLAAFTLGSCATMDETQKDTAKGAAIGAGAGAVVGAVAGGGKGAAIGAAVGGAGGTAVVLGTRGKPAEIPARTQLQFEVKTPVEITEKR
jgi:hypothetical protein